MNSREPQHHGPPQPVAYDAEGRPLYHHPPAPMSSPEPPQVSEAPAVKASHVTARPDVIEGQNFDPRIRSQYANEPDVVHAARRPEPAPFTISDELRRKHDASVLRYPHLNLSEAEYVILDIKRHPIGMLIPVSITMVLIVAIFAFAAIYPSLTSSATPFMPSFESVLIISMVLSVLVALGGAAALWVYLQNQFFMTNESVIQEIQESLFSRREQTVSLGSIEDASFRQAGILQMVFDYGTIRLSTEGEETTYIFRYVTNPKRQIAILNNAIEAFKNGRPVCDD